MGRHTELKEHILPETRSILLDGKVRKIIGKILRESNGRLMEIHIVQGEDVTYKQWEDIWTSGL